jgi:hypothetical protein
MSDTPKSIEQLRDAEKTQMAEMPKLPEATPTGALPQLQDPNMWILDPNAFERIWRIATALARSSLVPKHFQGKTEDCFIGTQMALALKCQPMQVLQNLYVVYGTPGFSSKFMIALANHRGPFDGVIQFKTIGQPGKNDYGVTAFARIRATGQYVERTVTMQMAVDEGWAKNNPKYKSMPEQMLSYRSAAFLIRLYCPEVLLGMSTADELYDTQGRYVDAEVIQAADGETYAAQPALGTTVTETEKKPPAAEEPQKPERKRQPKAATPAVQPVPDKAAPPPVKPAPVIPDARPGEQVPQTVGPTFKELNDMITLADESDDDLDTLLDLCSGFKGPFYSRLMELLARKYGVKRLAERGGDVVDVATKEDPAPTTGTFPGLE